MKSIVALCLFGAFAAVMAIPQNLPQHPPQVMVPPRPRLANIFTRPARPDLPRKHHGGLHAMRPMNGERPTHPIAHEISPALHEFMRDVREFVALYPRREIRNLIREHIRDPELRATMKFVRSEEFKQVMHKIAETPEFQAIGKYFEDADWPWLQKTVDEAINDIEHLPETVLAKRSTGGLSGLLDEIIAILPKEQLRALFDEKMEKSAVFRSVVHIMSSEELKTLMAAAHQSTEVRTQFGILLANGIDVEKIESLKFALVGY